MMFEIHVFESMQPDPDPHYIRIAAERVVAGSKEEAIRYMISRWINTTEKEEVRTLLLRESFVVHGGTLRRGEVSLGVQAYWGDGREDG